MLDLLNKIEVGIVALDIPQVPFFKDDENIVLGIAIVMGIFSQIGTPNIDPINKLPFMMHIASHSNEQQLDLKGLEKSTPGTKLGFHNDGLLSPHQIEIPEYIVVYNCYLNYQKPGYFMWIPTASWKEKEKYYLVAKKENRKIKIKLTPDYHSNEQGELVSSIAERIEAPISNINSQGECLFFLNGQVLPDENSPDCVNFIQEIRDSLERNSIKICIPQCERRAFYIKNTAGFHARTIFEEPIEGVDLTRVYLRAVDVSAELYSSL